MPRERRDPNFGIINIDNIAALFEGFIDIVLFGVFIVSACDQEDEVRRDTSVFTS